MKISTIILSSIVLSIGTVLANKEKKREPPTELKIKIQKKIPDSECPRKTKNGDIIKVHYDGKLFSNKRLFDTSRVYDLPIQFSLGSGQVIKGWDQGLLDMCVGEKRKLIIPYHLAYGEHGMPPTIPEKAALIFETELMEIKDFEVEKDEL